MINRKLRNKILRWHYSQGGAPLRAAGHALRLLNECVELCVASGASPLEINRTVAAEIYKAEGRGEFRSDLDMKAIREETADVTLLLSLFADYYFVDTQTAAEEKFCICESREWEPDEDGVLWRPRENIC